MGGGGQDAQLGWELRPALDARIPPAAWTLSTIAFPAGYFWRGNAGSTAVRKAEAASAADGPLPVFYTFREFRSFGKGITCPSPEGPWPISSPVLITRGHLLSRLLPPALGQGAHPIHLPRPHPADPSFFVLPYAHCPLPLPPQGPGQPFPAPWTHAGPPMP